MLFSTITFIYNFLPILLLLYFIVPTKFKNKVLLLFSIIFYFYGEPKYILVLLFSCFINFYAAKLIEKNRQKKKAKVLFIMTIIVNIGFLYYFKYTNFTIENINNLFNLDLSLMSIVMPIGISFFTFQTVSYVIDVYTKKIEADNNFFDFMTYVALFPQLVAGPIVRYIDIKNELKERKTSYDLFSKGVGRFVIGLAKKVLIANLLGEMCNNLASITAQTILSSWLEAIGFTLQIYFDFSGYSDMAIGLGLMFGFKFLENFNYPFIASSITNFWRRWHMSLSSWFRDYVYIPLGGNRVSKFKWIRNIFIVWFLTGFWHGASWNFILWGLYFAILLLIEKLFLQKFIEKHKNFYRILTIILVIFSFVIFNETDLTSIVLQFKDMFGLNGISFVNQETIYYFRSYLVLIIISVIASTPIVTNFSKKITQKYKWLSYLEPVYYAILLLVSTAFLIDASFNPFLYFRF